MAVFYNAMKPSLKPRHHFLREKILELKGIGEQLAPFCYFKIVRHKA